MPAEDLVYLLPDGTEAGLGIYNTPEGDVVIVQEDGRVHRITKETAYLLLEELRNAR